MLYTIMKHIRNFFHVPGAGKSGLFKVENGTIILPFLTEGQYFQIEGSILNDGVYQYPPADMQDEQFVGYIAPMAVPPDFLKLVDEISEWKKKAGRPGAFQSESFGGYSYTRATNKKGNPLTWKDVFREELNDWRKV